MNTIQLKCAADAVVSLSKYCIEGRDKAVLKKSVLFLHSLDKLRILNAKSSF